MAALGVVSVSSILGVGRRASSSNSKSLRISCIGWVYLVPFTLFIQFFGISIGSWLQWFQDPEGILGPPKGGHIARLEFKKSLEKDADARESFNRQVREERERRRARREVCLFLLGISSYTLWVSLLSCNWLWDWGFFIRKEWCPKLMKGWWSTFLILKLGSSSLKSRSWDLGELLLILSSSRYVDCLAVIILLINASYYFQGW